MFRLSYERDTSERANQGISELDLPERGYTSDSVQHELRFSLGRTAASLPSALSVRSVAQRATPDTVAPAIVVQNAFRAGGASVSGGDRGRSALLDTMFTLVARPYTLRAGSMVTYDSNLQGQLRNTLGTFTFTDLDAYAALLPSTFTQRRGAQPLTVAITQAAAFLQAEFVRWRWNFGAGLRYEVQSGVGDPGGLAPRLGVSRGFRRNRTNVRAGYGWFYGWMPVRIEEEASASQGSTEEEIIIRNPSCTPSPLAATFETRRDPPTRLALADDVELPRWQRASVGIDHQIRQGMRLNFDTYYETTGNDFRSLDLNAPVNGVRPDATFRRVLLVQSIGRVRRSGFNVDLSFSPRQGYFSNIRYGFSNNRNDGDDALTPPASGTYATEWARTREGPHRQLEYRRADSPLRADDLAQRTLELGQLLHHYHRARRQHRRDLQRPSCERRAQHAASAVDVGDRSARVVDAPVNPSEWQPQLSARTWRG